MRELPIEPTPSGIQQEHVLLCRSFGEVQARCTKVMAQQQAQIAALQAKVVRLRAALILRETQLALERERHAGKAAATTTPLRKRAAAQAASRPWQLTYWTGSAAL